MHLLKTLLAGAALIASTVAQGPPPALAFTSFPSDVQVGEPVTVTWTGADAGKPVTITLRRGPGENLQDVAVLTGSATGGTYTWEPSETLEDGDDYALQISQGDQVNYTGQFSVSGGSGSPPSSSAGSSATPAPSTPAPSTSVPSTSMSSPSSSTASVPSSAGTTLTLSSVTTPGPSSTISSSANHTMTQSTLSSTVVITPTPTEPNEEPTSPVPTDNAASSIAFSSPMALIVGALAAFAYIN